MTTKAPAGVPAPRAVERQQVPGSTAALWRQILADFERAAVRT